MQKIAIGLSALLGIAATSTRGATQDLGPELAALQQPDCGYVCLYADSVVVPWAPERRQSQLVKPQSETASPTSAVSATSNRGVQASRTVAPLRH
jgi:hypothetical protein